MVSTKQLDEKIMYHVIAEYLNILNEAYKDPC